MLSAQPLVATPCSSEAGMALLSSGVPLSLLLDLAMPPCSEELFVQEIPAQRQPS